MSRCAYCVCRASDAGDHWHFSYRCSCCLRWIDVEVRDWPWDCSNRALQEFLQYNLTCNMLRDEYWNNWRTNDLADCSDYRPVLRFSHPSHDPQSGMLWHRMYCQYCDKEFIGTSEGKHICRLAKQHSQPWKLWNSLCVVKLANRGSGSYETRCVL